MYFFRSFTLFFFTEKGLCFWFKFFFLNPFLSFVPSSLQEELFIHLLDLALCRINVNPFLAIWICCFHFLSGRFFAVHFSLKQYANEN